MGGDDKLYDNTGEGLVMDNASIVLHASIVLGMKDHLEDLLEGALLVVANEDDDAPGHHGALLKGTNHREQSFQCRYYQYPRSCHYHMKSIR